MNEKLVLAGQFRGELFRLINGRLTKIDEWIYNNGITNEGKNYVLDAGFNAGTQHGTWYMGLIDNDAYASLAAADTMASHAGWAEFTDYDEAARPEWGAGAASGQQITNASPVVFTINAAGTLRGGFITSDSTKGGSGGVLWSTALYSVTRAVVIGDVVRNTYTLGT